MGPASGNVVSGSWKTMAFSGSRASMELVKACSDATVRRSDV